MPKTYTAGLTGAILTCSIVPRSFSRTIESAVEMTAVIIAIYAMSPGTRNNVLRSCGLYQTRGSSATGGVTAMAVFWSADTSRDDRLGIAHDRRRSVGVLAVDDDLHARRPVILDIAAVAVRG